ncbi:MAG: pseudouridine synthase [Lutisporaceae bacterium]
MEERLQKIMAELGVASRRKCEELILQGKVKVNAVVVKELGVKADKLKDIIEVEGRALNNQTNKIYLMLNKPAGYITSTKDQFNRPAVLDLISEVKERIFPIGRLDFDTEGLLILTNDGDLTYKITHPSHNIDKTYRALVVGKIEQSDIDTFTQGIVIDGFKTSPAKLELLEIKNNNSLVDITIHEGRNRQVRKMCDAVNHGVIMLKRISIGKLKLGDLMKGHWRYLNEEEVKYLYSIGEKL